MSASFIQLARSMFIISPLSVLLFVQLLIIDLACFIYVFLLIYVQLTPFPLVTEPKGSSEVGAKNIYINSIRVSV